MNFLENLLHPFFHSHKWKIIACEQYNMWPRGAAHDSGPSECYTVVLYKCECECLRTKRIDGLWTIEELRGEQ